MRKKLFLIFILVISLCCMSCTKEDEKNSTNNTNDVTNENFTYKYKETSDVSILAYNNTTKYTKEHTSAKLYEWNENVVLPIPSPANIVEEIPEDGKLTFSGLSYENWLSYIEEIKTLYTNVDIANIELEDGTIFTYNALIQDENIGFSASLHWAEELNYGVGEPGEKEIKTINNVLTVYCQLFNQEDYNNVSIDVKAEIQKMSKTAEDIVLLDITSKTNYEEGYAVYYVDSFENMQSRMLCVVKNDKIVFLEDNMVTYGMTHNEIEFVSNGDKDIMYLLAYESDKDPLSSNTGRQQIDKYILKDGTFVHDKTMYVNEIEGCANKAVTFERDGDDIILREVTYNTDLNDNYTEFYILGDKLTVLEQ